MAKKTNDAREPKGLVGYRFRFPRVSGWGQVYVGGYKMTLTKDAYEYLPAREEARAEMELVSDMYALRCTPDVSVTENWKRNDEDGSYTLNVIWVRR